MATGAAEKLTVLAGGGHLPREVIEAASRRGDHVLAISIADEADLDGLPGSVETDRVGWGEVGRLMKRLETFEARRLVIVGSISQRPDYRALKLDWGAMQMLPRIVGTVLAGGDDSVLDKVAAVFADRGFELVGAHVIAPELVAQEGHLAGPKPQSKTEADLAQAAVAAWTAGHLDMGQGAIVVGGRLIAMEGAEGTDGMLTRVTDMRKARRFSAKGQVGALAKCSRPGQDLRLDMPAIGPRTVELAAAAGLAAVVIEAGRVLISQRDATMRRCQEEGVSLMAWPRTRFVPDGQPDIRHRDRSIGDAD